VMACVGPTTLPLPFSVYEAQGHSSDLAFCLGLYIGP
jgi:hypothetical protein